MRQRLALSGQDPDAVMGTALPPLEEGPTPEVAFARAKAMKAGLEDQARTRRN